MPAVVSSAAVRRWRRFGDSRSQDRHADRLIRRFGYSVPDLEGLLAAASAVREPVPIMGTGINVVEGVMFPAVGGGAFATYADVVNALGQGLKQDLVFAKVAGSSSANAAASLWGNAGMPAAGAFGTALTAATKDSTAVGAMPYNNAGGARTMYLVSAEAASTLAFGTLMVYDRLAEYPLNGSVTSGTFTSVTLPARDAAGATAGAGVLAFIENDVAGATATAANLTLTYTNSAGTASRSTGAQALAAGIVQRILLDRIFIPLAAGDSGVRTIQSYTLSATITTTKATVVLCRVLGFLPVMVANAVVSRDLILQLAQMPIVYASTAFAFAAMANSSTTPVTGRLVIAEG